MCLRKREREVHNGSSTRPYLKLAVLKYPKAPTFSTELNQQFFNYNLCTKSVVEPFKSTRFSPKHQMLTVLLKKLSKL